MNDYRNISPSVLEEELLAQGRGGFSFNGLVEFFETSPHFMRTRLQFAWEVLAVDFAGYVVHPSYAAAGYKASPKDLNRIRGY